MTIMTPNEFLIYSIREKLVYKLSWYKSVFAIPKSNNLLISIVNGIYTYNDIQIDCDVKEPILRIKDIVKIPEGLLKIRSENFEDTAGGVLINLLIVEHAFKGTLPYFKEEFSYKDDIKTFLKEGIADGTFIYEDIVRITNTFLLTRNISKIIVTPISRKVYLPPKWLKEFKNNLIKEYKKKYGDKCLEDQAIVLQLEADIMDKVKLHFKDDPTYGITFDKKALSSFKKRYVSIGYTESLTPNTKNEMIMESLSEGWPSDRDKITGINNSIIFGSNARAKMTVIAGTFAKHLVTAMHAISVDVDDCGTTDGVPFVIRDIWIDALLPLYRVSKGKAIKNSKEYLMANIGKTIIIRLPLYCKANGDHLCKVCSGEYLSMNKNSPSLIASETGGDNLNFRLSFFHGVDRSLKKFELEDLF